MHPPLSFDHFRFTYEPYPIGIARDVLPPDYYSQLISAWPRTELFEFKKMLGNKYSLSEVNNPAQYHRFVRSQPVWRDFHAFVKSREFLQRTIAMLYSHHMDLGLGGKFLVKDAAQRSFVEKLKVYRHVRKLSARFEYSMLPADGGFIKPHTDAPNKIITLVFSMMPTGEWDDRFGGGTDVLKPRDIQYNYNYMNKQFEFDQMETVSTFPFEPNQCVVFIKTFNSWHSVSPLKGTGSKIMRKTLTVNIETK
jgi:hypothetical protein